MITPDTVVSRLPYWAAESFRDRQAPLTSVQLSFHRIGVHVPDTVKAWAIGQPKVARLIGLGEGLQL